MPVSKMKIKSTRKANFGEIVEVNNYWFDETCEPLAVIYGCFSPFTGKYGHGRLLDAAKKQGIKKFLIISPDKKEDIDDNRSMFTPKQKIQIAKEGCLDLGYDVIDARLGKYSFVLGNLNEVALEFPKSRIVLVCGPDRASSYGKDLIPFDKNRTEELPDPDNRGKFELLVVDSRGSKNVSGTKIRELIREDEKEQFLDMTGYSEDIWNLCRKFAIMNGVVTESFYEHCQQVNEALESTKRVGIKHLYNPGNTQELPPLDFMTLVDLINSEGGVLENGKNVSITEKSDGAAFRFGLDEEGKFFIEQAYSGPIYTQEDFITNCKERTGGVNRNARGWSNIFNTLKTDTKTQQAFKKIFDKFGAFKLIGEIYISDLGYEDKDGYVTFVGSRYDKSKLGKKATIILFNVVNASNSVIDFMKKASSENIKYDDAEIDGKIKINVKKEIKEIRKNLLALEEDFGDITEILSNTSRKREDVALRKELKSLIEEQQGILNSAIESQLKDYVGKWGPDYEGFVFKFSDGSLVKITSIKFKEFKSKHDDTISKWLKELEG